MFICIHYPFPLKFRFNVKEIESGNNVCRNLKQEDR